MARGSTSVKPESEEQQTGLTQPLWETADITASEAAPAAPEPAAPEPEKAAPKPKPDETYVYIGPSIPRSALKENALFHGSKDSVLKFVAEVAEKYPLVRRLIVHIDDLAVSKGKITDGGNALSKAYQLLSDEIKKK